MARDEDGIIQIVYANSGDTGLGGLDLNELWDITYSQPGGALPQRIQFNQLYKNLSALAVEINQKGPFLEYSDKINYKVGSWVTGTNGFQYYCRVANGPSSSVVDPVGNPTEWKLGSNNTSLVIGADGTIDDGSKLQLANVTSSRLDVSTGGTGGQGAARKAMYLQATDSLSFMDLDCFDYDLASGVKLRINTSGGEVGIGTTPTTGKALHVDGDALFNDNLEVTGTITTGTLSITTLNATNVLATGTVSGNILSAPTGNIDTINSVNVNATNVVDATNHMTAPEFVAAGKVLAPDNTAFFTNLTGQTINTGSSDYNVEDLGSLSINDVFMVTVGISGTRVTGASELSINITNSGTGTISGPHNQDGASETIYSPNTGGFDNSFSFLCNVSVAGTVILTLAALTDANTMSSVAIGMRVQFFRKA